FLAQGEHAGADSAACIEPSSRHIAKLDSGVHEKNPRVAREIEIGLHPGSVHDQWIHSMNTIFGDLCVRPGCEHGLCIASSRMAPEDEPDRDRNDRWH